MASNNRKYNTILQIKNEQGKGWEEADYLAAVRQGISTPEDINATMHQLRILWALSTYVVGDKSLLPNALALLIEQINHHCIIFEAMQINNDQFFTKFGGIKLTPVSFAGSNSVN